MTEPASTQTRPSHQLGPKTSTARRPHHTPSLIFSQSDTRLAFTRRALDPTPPHGVLRPPDLIRIEESLLEALSPEVWRFSTSRKRLEWRRYGDLAPGKRGRQHGGQDPCPAAPHVARGSTGVTPLAPRRPGEQQGARRVGDDGRRANRWLRGPSIHAALADEGTMKQQRADCPCNATSCASPLRRASHRCSGCKRASRTVQQAVAWKIPGGQFILQVSGRTIRRAGAQPPTTHASRQLFAR